MIDSIRAGIRRQACFSYLSQALSLLGNRLAFLYIGRLILEPPFAGLSGRNRIAVRKTTNDRQGRIFVH